ncbi:MAG: hypothetical protein K0S23_533 [Fluviicola sp.]|jgi:hypothetical protein|uniref:hypothetical protein n=1 Tax=Fluviicola sp. TaxID=1917219 RepID=UPI00260EBA40|nr:hypothetical protein [Fluviicola sp.]MDF3026226.1 hypothetical protein [Fluviicola sp.]
MCIQKFICVFICGISLVSCNKGKPLPVPEMTTSFVKNSDTNLSGSVFFIGPELDSVNMEIIAACDCCASDLAFPNDSSFLYVERCMGGDVYVKGNYLIFGNVLFLHTDNKIVSSEYEISPDTDLTPKYEVIQQKGTYHAYLISNLKGKEVISFTKDDFAEYGMPTQISISSFLEEFRKEKVLREFLSD